MQILIFVAEGVNNFQCGIIRWSRHNHQLGLLCRTFRYAKMGMGSRMRQRFPADLLVFLGDCRRLAFNIHFGWGTFQIIFKKSWNFVKHLFYWFFFLASPCVFFFFLICFVLFKFQKWFCCLWSLTLEQSYERKLKAFF